MKNRIFYPILAVLLLFAMGCGEDDLLNDDFTCSDMMAIVKVNDIQVIGSHNSYRIRPPEAIMQLLYNSPELLPADFDPGSWDYTHENLANQLDEFKMRSLELDVYRDPEGGLFYARRGNAFVGMDPVSGKDELLQPGLKVMHFPDFDYLSHHLTFTGALTEIRNWSLNNPNHLPLTILVEAKEDSPDQLLPGYGLTTTLPFDKAGLNEIEEEINEVFGGQPSHIFIPDQLRKEHNSLNEAILAGNWPHLDDVRGKIIFVLMGSDATIAAYTEDAPSLSGKTMFVFSEAGSPSSAFLKIDDPLNNYTVIKNRIREGYIVRTRADADTYESRNGDFSRFYAAIESGAQIISTDYYRMDPRSQTDPSWSVYEVSFGNHDIAQMITNYGESEMLECSITE